MPDELWLAIRQYLTRMGQLDPGVGRSIAERLAGELVVRTGAATPQGIPAAAFLAAVVHERQSRDARRVFAGPRAQGPVPSGVAAPGGSGGPGGHFEGSVVAVAGGYIGAPGGLGAAGAGGFSGAVESGGGGGSVGGGPGSGVEGGAAGAHEQRRGGAPSAGFAPPG